MDHTLPSMLIMIEAGSIYMPASHMMYDAGISMEPAPIMIGMVGSVWFMVITRLMLGWSHTLCGKTLGNIARRERGNAPRRHKLRMWGRGLPRYGWSLGVEVGVGERSTRAVTWQSPQTSEVHFYVSVLLLYGT